MTTDQPPPNVAALVDAIDARARQAGNEGATAVVERMLGSVTELLARIQDRLDHLEETISSGAGASAGRGGVADAIQAGLAAFNARLGRLEEAFVQAVDDSGSGTQAVVDEVREAVARVLEETLPPGRAASSTAPVLDPETRAALSRVEAALSGLAVARDERPAQEVVGLALTAMGERLDALEQRLVVAVQQHAPPAARADLSTLDLQEQLAPLHDRLDASEGRVSAAVEAASRDAVNAALAPALDRLDNVERRLLETPREVSTSVEAAFEVVQVRIASLEQLLRGRVNERVDASAAVRAALAPLTERMDELDAAHRSTAARHHDSIGRVEAALAALPGRLTSLEDRVWAVVSSLTEGTAPPLDATLLVRLEEAVERLDRDEASARLVKLVEDRMSAGLRAVTERTDEVRRAMGQLAAPEPGRPSDDGALDDLVASVRALQSATAGIPDEVSAALSARLVPFSDRLSGLDDRLDALTDLVIRSTPASPDPTEALAHINASLSALTERVADLGDDVASLRATAATAGEPGAAGLDVSEVVERIDGAVRREAELLTQRVAALAVGVEATRVLLDQHLHETESSIGRKAGEVTRRLAADFGIRTRRTAPGGRRDPRELGSGD